MHADRTQPSDDLTNPALFINRELSFLTFNQRVLEQARDERVPLLERLRFLAISCSNLDEFFEIRVAGLKQRLELDNPLTGPDGLTPQEQLDAIAGAARGLVGLQYQVLNQALLPAMADRGIRLIGKDSLSRSQAHWAGQYFEREVEPVLSPLGLDPGRPFPRIQNKSLNFIARVSGSDAFGRDTTLAVVQVPRSLPRVIRIPDGELRDLSYILLSTVIHGCIDRLFPGITVEGCWQFRVTRNSDLYVDDEEVDDLLRAVEGELAHRRYGAAVRLETSHDCPEDLVDFLRSHFTLSPSDVFAVQGPVNLNRMTSLCDLADRPDLKYPAFTPGLPPRVVGSGDLFAVIRERDLLLSHPFQSFQPVIDFVRQAAADPHVLAIKMTLYRTGADSSIVASLIDAARSGKDVTVIVELRARFDEAANIELANRLQEAGAHVMYGVVGFKTHAKLILVVRRESGALIRYCHLGTGNYHARTARLYTDYGLFTCDAGVGDDVHNIFLQLTSLIREPKLDILLQAPFTLHAAMIAKIDREIANAREGRVARIVAKMNSLIEPQIIQALYRASRAGVRVDLIVRGICALRPGIPGVSDNITVRSIIGRFLEHSRVFWFANGDDDELFCGSADWMERNFFRRVEICFPVLRDRHRKRIIRDLELCLADNTGAWSLEANGRYARVGPGTPPVTAQQLLLEKYADQRPPG
jgi:polyphosphate kinase